MTSARISKLPKRYGYCSWCKKPVKKPRYYWCGPECIHEGKLRTNPTYVRECVLKRDKGICAGCGTDTIAKLDEILLDWVADSTVIRTDWGYFIKGAVPCSDHHAVGGFRTKKSKRSPTIFWTSAEGLKDPTLKGLCRQFGWQHLCSLSRNGCGCALCVEGRKWNLPNRSTLWDADHIKPVAEGGGGCGLDNYQTLCILCHIKKSVEQLKRSPNRSRINSAIEAYKQRRRKK